MNGVFWRTPRRAGAAGIQGARIRPRPGGLLPGQSPGPQGGGGRSRLVRRLLAGTPAIMAVAVAAAGCSSAPSPQHTISTSPGAPWTRVWSDSFNGPAGRGVSSRWMYNTGHGNFGTGEIETMTNSPANVHLDGQGNLDIVPLRSGSSWTSGRIQTRSSAFAAPAGGEMLITATFRQPPAADPAGYWTGFWIIGKGQWPERGEIDILEDVDSTTSASGSLHCGNLTQPNADGTKGPCHETTGLGSGQRPCPGCQNSYHTYSVIIDRRTASEQIRWFRDGREYFHLDENRVGKAAWAEGVDSGFSIIFDVAIGGGYPNIKCGCQTPAPGTTSGAAMSVRNVAVYTTPH